ncbi:MAG: hypothetical protein MRJ96_15285 [Nitrospirales bacterium]|nr:hypothetical protein [Nitrospirales bacterium]
MIRFQYIAICSLSVIFFVIHFLLSPEAFGQARTETNCNFGMVKGQEVGSCNVPIPSSCTVAQIPGFDKPWADISKGGNTNCQFDEKQSDWETTIVGTCDTCKTDHCSARFSVMFNCSSTTTPPNMQRQAH